MEEMLPRGSDNSGQVIHRQLESAGEVGLGPVGEVGDVPHDVMTRRQCDGILGGLMQGRVVCAGGAVADLKFHLAAAAVAGTSNPATVSVSSGGMARNVAENLAGLLGDQWQVEMVTAVGADPAGQALLDQLRDNGIGVEHVRTLPGCSTAQYAAVLQPGGDLHIGVAVMDVLERVESSWLEAAWPEQGWVFCDTNLPAGVLAQALGRARGTGTALAVGAVSTPKVIRLPKRLDGIALLSCNVEEARAWLTWHGQNAGGDDGALALRLHQAGAAAVLLTRGAEGVIAADRQGFEQIPAVRADVVDVTGAGDALIAGALAALITGDTLLDAARAGAHRAARTIESPLSVLPRASAYDR